MIILFFHIIKMPETKTIVLALVFIVVIGIGAYFAFFKKSTVSTDGDGKGFVKTPPPPPESCGGQLKPIITCDDGQKLICDKGRWRCELKCESNSNPFPTTFNNCINSDNIKCDENGRYYCKGSTECQHEGILYQDGCHCGSAFTGKQCQCSSTTCGKGQINEDCTCATCCDPSTAIDGKCKIYNGPAKKCEGNCEQDKGLNFVFDPTKGACVCPRGFSLSPENGICKPINCGANGRLDDATNKCICKSADWSGALCNNKVCGEHGRMGPDGKCVCDSGYAGSVCQFSRADCDGHGNPSVDKNDNLVCVCDAEYAGAHCRCKISEMPTFTETDKCKGAYSMCNDSDGRWKIGQNPCGKIYTQYGTEQKWHDTCGPLLLSKPDFEDNMEISCRDNTCPVGKPDCPPEFQSFKTCRTKSIKNTCNSSPGQDCPYCVCNTTFGEPSYSCQKAQTNECGDRPPGFCTTGDNPTCISTGARQGKLNLWQCQGTVLPKDFAIQKYGLVPISGLNAYWDPSVSGGGTSVYPTMNMDSCTTTPFTLVDKLDFPSGFRSMGSDYGFIKDYGKPTQKFIPASNVPDNLMVYNYTNGNKLPVANIDQMTADGYGCAKYTSYEDRTACKKDANGNPRGKFIQKCAELNGNPVSCSDSKARIRFDTGKCDCNPPYKGDYCQYSDNENCSGHGTVDNNGNCTSCNTGWTGKNCQYSNATNCNNRGDVDANGNCTCFSYKSSTEWKPGPRGSIFIDKSYLGSACQFGDEITCGGNGGIVQLDGSCKWFLKNGDQIRISLKGTQQYLSESQSACANPWAFQFMFQGDSSHTFTWVGGSVGDVDLSNFLPTVPSSSIGFGYLKSDQTGNYAHYPPYFNQLILTRVGIGMGLQVDKDPTVDGYWQAPYLNPTLSLYKKLILVKTPEGFKMMVYSTTPFTQNAQLFTLGYVTVHEDFGYTTHDHTLLGFVVPGWSGSNNQPIYMDISKKGKDGQWYPVDGFKNLG